MRDFVPTKIAAPTDDELRAFMERAADPYYPFTSFDIRVYNRCIYGHVHHMRGGQSWEVDKPGVGDAIQKAIWDTGNSRLVRLIGVERVPGQKPYRTPELRLKDFEKREDVAISFKLFDAVNAVKRYFDDSIEETAIWPWAARGYRNINLWASK